MSCSVSIACAQCEDLLLNANDRTTLEALTPGYTPSELTYEWTLWLVMLSTKPSPPQYNRGQMFGLKIIVLMDINYINAIIFLQTLYDSFAKIELLKFASMFECEVGLNVVTKTFRTIIRDQFRNEVDL